MVENTSKHPKNTSLKSVCVLNQFSHVQFLESLRIVARRLLCPWDSPGKNTGVGCHTLLQGIFLILGSNARLFCLLHWQAGSLPLAPPGKPIKEDKYEIRSCVTFRKPSFKLKYSFTPSFIHS